MEPFWYENLPDKGCQLCLPQLEGLRMQLFEPRTPSPRCLSFDLPGPWQGASSSLLLLGQSSDCDLSVRCRVRDSLGARRPNVLSSPPSPYEWKTGKHCPMSQLPRDRGRHGLSWFLPSVLQTAGWLWLVSHRFPVQKHTPFKKAWVQKRGRIHCAQDVCAQLPLHRHLWDWTQASGFPIPEMMVSLCEPAQTKEVL